MTKKKPLTMQLLSKKLELQEKKIATMEMVLDEILRSTRETVNPMLLEHETYIHELKNKSWLERFLGL